MKIAYNWLKEYIDTELSSDEIGKLLTSGGLEVEDIIKYTSIIGSLDHVVVGEVLSKEKHPDADKLSLTSVNVGDETLQIVCGAPNVDKGQKVIVAKVGSLLTTTTGEKIAIKKSKIRGIESNGMICAEDELGLGTSHEGIMILPSDTKVGTLASDYFEVVNDEIIEIGLTPNRGDAYTHIGTARDLVALMNVRNDKDVHIKFPEIAKEEECKSSNPISVDIQQKEKCKRYTGVFIKNIEVTSSPKWLANKLKSIGVRPINNIVDITNFILHEYGQPLHAFDADKIQEQKIIVRNAKVGEEFVTLDNKKINLLESDLVIADVSKVLCIAGVYGSNNSGITDSTKNIFLESAFFDATSLRVSGTKHDLRTDASMHFEKGTDINITKTALLRAILLLKETCPDIECSIINDNIVDEIKAVEIAISYKNVRRLIGVDIATDSIHNILKSLDFKIKNNNDEGFICVVPSCKTEVTREADVIEEILRIYGFDKIPNSTDVYATLSFRTKPDKQQVENNTAQFLVANGFFEMMSNPISQSKYYAEDSSLVKLANSMTAELDILRSHLIYGALETISYNINRKNNKLRLFEWGNIFETIEEGYSQKSVLGIYMLGNLVDNSWSTQLKKITLFDLKSYVEEILNLNGVADLTIDSNNKEQFYATSIKILKGDKVIATLGSVNKKLLKDFDIKDEAFVAFINWDLVLNYQKKKQIKYTAVSKFPTIKRDLALVIDKSCTYESIKISSQKALKNVLKEMVLFDEYEGDKIASDKKSYAISYIIGDDSKTLSDTDIDKMMNKLIDTLTKEHQAILRN
jgi:phenylalanyl-tRNA synthetase beta chain